MFGATLSAAVLAVVVPGQQHGHRSSTAIRRLIDVSATTLRIGLVLSVRDLRHDAIAALTVAALSLPQGMAYALLAGVDPRYGLYSAIVVTFVASVFGSSRHLMNGPTSAISLVVFGTMWIFDANQRADAAEAMFLAPT